MSRLGDVLELMFTAHSRVLSVRAVLREWTDTALWQESARRWAAMGTPGSRAVITAESAGPEPGQSVDEHVHRVWHEPAGTRWRVEYSQPWGESLIVLDGDRWWGSDGPRGISTNVGADGSVSDVGRGIPSRLIELMLDPASLLAWTTLEAGDATSFAGRPAVEAVARWREGIDLVNIDWPYADEVRVLVDAEYGVLLRLETFLDGRPFIRWEALEIAFDEDLPDTTFAPIPGARRYDGPPEVQPEAIAKLLEEFRAMGHEESPDE